MDLQLNESTAIVLASSKGIGRAAAKTLVAEGGTVAISSRSEQNLREAKEAILSETGASSERVLTMTCDHQQPATVGDTVQEAIDRLGGLDILVTNSAGPPKVGFEEASLSDFDDTYNIVLKSVIAAIEAALPSLLDDGGAITNIIAASTQQPEPNHILANTIRPGIYGLSKSLAQEYADEGLRVNNVCPKKVGDLTPQEVDRTTHIDRYAEAHDLSYDEARAQYIAEIIPRGEFGEREKFGRAVAFISSDEAAHINGNSLNVDGGWVRSLQ